MTILPKKKHPDGKKNEPNSGNDLRHSRSRNNCARTSGERTNRSAEEINETAVYRSGNLELRSTSESSSNGKRRYRNTNNDYRRRDETGYNSEDEYDASNCNEQPTEEVSTASCIKHGLENTRMKLDILSSSCLVQSPVLCLCYGNSIFF